MFDFLANKFSSVFSSLTGNSKLTEKNIDTSLTKLKEALLEADVPYAVADTFLVEVKQEVLGQDVLKSLKPDEQFIKIVHDKMVHFLGGTQKELDLKKTSIVMVMGLQGSGKTTTIAKLAHFYKKKGYAKILVGSVDYYRPAAIDQLQILAQQTNVDFYRAQSNDPVQAANEIVQEFKKSKADLLLLDTAGRMHIDNQMLSELQEISSSIQPDIKLLVLDAMTGQESLRVAQAFQDSIGFNGAVLSKMDSESKGGAAFTFAYTLKKPIYFVGTGEKPTDFESFVTDRMASRMIGMGDVQTLLEKAEASIEKAEAQKMEQSLKTGSFTLDDFAKQLDMMGRLGSLSSIMRYIPGMNSKAVPQDALEKGEREMKKFKAIMSSMTKKERFYPEILNGSRKKRIARGSGVGVSDVSTLLDRFEQTKQFAKLFKGMM